MNTAPQFVAFAVARFNAFKAYVEETDPAKSHTDLAHEGGEVIRDLMNALLETEGATGALEPFSELATTAEVPPPPAEDPK